MTIERSEAFDLVGTMVTLLGPELKPGDTAPDFTLLDKSMKPISKADLAGKPLVLNVVPSLDTPVCSLQAARFDKEAARLGDTVQMVVVSADLPFAQTRWAKEKEARNELLLSDHRDMNFGTAYGTHIKGVRLESRAVFIVDADGIIRYVEYVPAAAQEPDYDSALQALHTVLNT